MNSRQLYNTSLFLIRILMMFFIQTNAASWEINIMQTAAGNHFAYLDSEGNLFASGGGTGTGFYSYSSAYPRIVHIDTDVEKVTAGRFSTAYIKTNGSLWGVGTLYDGPKLLGDFKSGLKNKIEPVEIEPDGVVDVSLHQSTLFYVKTDGSLWGAGLNEWGQLGDGTTLTKELPVQILPAGVKNVAAGLHHTLVLMKDGSVKAMGRHSNGRLGNDDSSESISTIPVEVASSDVLKISAGYQHSAFIKSDGSLWTMGLNEHGQLGNGSTEDSLVPVRVIAQEVINVSTGQDFTIFMKEGGSLWGMGNNKFKQLGEFPEDKSLLPVKLIDTGVVQISSGRLNNYFIKSDNTLWGMGRGISNLNWGNPNPNETYLSIMPILLSHNGNLNINPEGGGQIIGYKKSDSTARIVAVPKVSYFDRVEFVNWSGYSDSKESDTEVPFGSNITANFTKDMTDEDEDNLPLYREVILDTNPHNSDTDFDSYTDHEEYLNGTDPTSWTTPSDYIPPSEQDPTIELDGFDVYDVSGNGNDQLAVTKENSVDIYQITNNTELTLIESIPLPGSFSGYGNDKTILTNSHLFVRISNSIHIFTVGDSAGDFTYIGQYGTDTYSDSLDSNFASESSFITRGNGWKYYRINENNDVIHVSSITKPTSEEVIGSIESQPQGELSDYEVFGGACYSNGMISIPTYARSYDSENVKSEWMYVALVSASTGEIMDIYSPSKPGRITNIEMDDNHLVVTHANHNINEAGYFTDIFNIKTRTSSQIIRSPGSNEYLKDPILDSDDSIIYFNSGTLYYEGIGGTSLRNQKLVAYTLNNNSIKSALLQFSRRTVNSWNDSYTLSKNYVITHKNNDPIYIYPKQALAKIEVNNLTYYCGKPQNAILSLTLGNENLVNQHPVKYKTDDGIELPTGELPVDTGKYYASLDFPDTAEFSSVNDLEDYEFEILPFPVEINHHSVDSDYGSLLQPQDILISIEPSNKELNPPEEMEALTTNWFENIHSKLEEGISLLDADLPAGTKKELVLSLEDLNETYNYGYTFTTSGNIIVNTVKSTLTLSAQPLQFTYKEEVNINHSYSITGFKSGESESSLRSTGDLNGEPSITISGVDISTALPGSYPDAVKISKGTLDATNYKFEYISADLVIDKGLQDFQSLPNSLTIMVGSEPTALPSVVPNSGLPIEWKVEGEGNHVGIGEDGIITPLQEGSITLLGTQAGDERYQAASHIISIRVVEYDKDDDGLSYEEELTIGTNPDDADTDGDDLEDGKEINLGTNPNHEDSDGDGLNDFVEDDIGSNPLVSDKIIVDYLNTLWADQVNTARAEGIEEGKEEVTTNPLEYGLVGKEDYDRVQNEILRLQDPTSSPYTDGWYYVPHRGWFWTTKDVFPYLYNESSKSWMYFKSGFHKPRFFDFGTKQWTVFD